MQRPDTSRSLRHKQLLHVLMQLGHFSHHWWCSDRTSTCAQVWSVGRKTRLGLKRRSVKTRHRLRRCWREQTSHTWFQQKHQIQDKLNILSQWCARFNINYHDIFEMSTASSRRNSLSEIKYQYSLLFDPHHCSLFQGKDWLSYAMNTGPCRIIWLQYWGTAHLRTQGRGRQMRSPPSFFMQYM